MNKMFNIKYLTRDVEIHPLVRTQRKTGDTVYLLFHSLWDPTSQQLVSSVMQNASEDGDTLYLINSFDTPDAPWTKFRVGGSSCMNTAPALVTLGKYPKPRTETRVSQIYRHLGL